ncbi:MAG: BrnT family toxin [Oscillospiraceae bacterium]|nr:BrnT family toxin [Oscillospiraceae bacterium]
MATISYALNDLTEVTFEWDSDKDDAVYTKHGVRFTEAATVFLDVNALMMSDPDHSEQEDRFLQLGYSTRANLLIVSYCVRYSDTVIRLISARKATKKEAMTYHKRC